MTKLIESVLRFSQTPTQRQCTVHLRGQEYESTLIDLDRRWFMSTSRPMHVKLQVTDAFPGVRGDVVLVRCPPVIEATGSLR